MNKRILAAVMVLVILVMIPFSATMVSADEKSDAYKNKIAALQEKEAEYQAELEDTNNKIKDKKKYSESLVGQIDVLNQQITEAQNEISKLNSSIAEKQESIDEANKKIENQMDALKKRVRTIFMAGETSDLEIILGAKDFSDFLDKRELVKNLSAYDEKLINEIQAELDKVAGEKQALEVERKEREDSKAIIDEKQGKLQNLLDENEEVLASLYDDKENAEALIAHAQQQESEIQDKLDAYYASLRAAAANNNNSTSGNNNSGNSNSNIAVVVPATGGYTWPVPGYMGVISSFGEDRGYSHSGVDITGGGIMGATTVAANSGTVIASNNSCSHNWGKSGSCGCGGGYGNYVLIDHGNGKTTMYAHLSSATVYTGASVSKGQTIGYVGSTGWSTGAHLHYETRMNGAVYNPMSEY